MEAWEKWRKERGKEGADCGWSHWDSGVTVVWAETAEAISWSDARGKTEPEHKPLAGLEVAQDGQRTPFSSCDQGRGIKVLPANQLWYKGPGKISRWSSWTPAKDHGEKLLLSDHGSLHLSRGFPNKERHGQHVAVQLRKYSPGGEIQHRLIQIREHMIQGKWKKCANC